MVSIIETIHLLPAKYHPDCKTDQTNLEYYLKGSVTQHLGESFRSLAMEKPR